MRKLEKKAAKIPISKRYSISDEVQEEGTTSGATAAAAAAAKETQKVYEEEDSLHGATTDLGGTTIPA